MFTLVSYLCTNEIAHNLFVTRGKRFDESLPDSVYDTVRVFVWAREPSFGMQIETKENKTFFIFTRADFSYIMSDISHL